MWLMPSMISPERQVHLSADSSEQGGGGDEATGEDTHGAPWGNKNSSQLHRWSLDAGEKEELTEATLKTEEIR